MATTSYRDTWVWYLPVNMEAHATALQQSGCTRALVKAGGDGGRVWSQYGLPSAAYNNYAIADVPWLYATPDEIEWAAAVGALRRKWSDELILNPEIEWWGKSREFTLAWLDGLRRAIRAAHGRAPLIGWSSVPTWQQFPYEAWSEGCDGTEQPQVYWRLSRANQVQASNNRARRGATIVPILPACQSEDSGGDGMSWTDGALAGLVTAINTGLRDQRGYSGWQSGATGTGGQARGDYAHAAMRAAYDSLPALEILADQPAQGLGLPFNDSQNPAVWHCAATDIWVIDPQFIARYLAQGKDALDIYGLPVSGMSLDASGRAVQYFERARFERHGDIALLGRVGAELLEAQARASTWTLVPKLVASADEEG